jgi:hypothetical protein
MARLPGINYNTQVQSLGRQDTAGPMRVAQAEGAAISKWTDVAGQAALMIETNQIAGYSANMSNQMSELNAIVQNTKAYSAEQLKEAGIDLRDGREMVPAHEVAVEYYKKRSDEIYQANTKGLGYKGKKVMERTFATKYGPGIDAAVGTSITYGQQYASAKSDYDFENAVKSGNAEGAMMVADTAIMNGTWSPDQYQAKVGPLAGRVTERNYLMRMDATDSVAELEQAQEELLYNEDMTTAQISKLYTKYKSKIDTNNKIIEKEIEARKVESSSVAMNTLTSRITEGEKLTAEQMLDEIVDYTPADRKAAMAVWRGAMNEPAVSNTDSLTTAALLVRGSLIDDGVSTFQERRVTVELQLNGMLERGDLKVQDWRNMMTDLKAVQEVPLKTPEYRIAEDDLYAVLTGGSKEMFSFDPGSKPMALADATWELNQATLEGGPRFDPRKWWDANKLRFVTSAQRENRKAFRKEQAEGVAVVEKSGELNLRATVDKVNNLVKAGVYTREEADMMLNEFYEGDREIQRLNRLAEEFKAQ